jgi:hypothetical protein
MQKVIMYKSDYGEVFETEEEAKFHDRGEQCRIWYTCNMIRGASQEDSTAIPWDVFLRWLLHNFDAMRELMDYLENRRNLKRK